MPHEGNDGGLDQVTDIDNLKARVESLELQVQALLEARQGADSRAKKAARQARWRANKAAKASTETPTEASTQRLQTSTNAYKASTQVGAAPSNAPSLPVASRKASTKAIECPVDVDPQVWADWLDLRKRKKAPVTQTVVDSAMRESSKARISFEEFLRIWCLRGSQGLQADWIKPSEISGAKPKSFRERDQELAEDLMRAVCPNLVAPKRELHRDFIDMPTSLPKFLEN